MDRTVGVTMSQDTFNKIYTLLITGYFMVMYTASWYTGKPIDLATLVAFMIPSGVHGINLVTQGMVDRKNIEKDTQIAMKNGVQLWQEEGYGLHQR